MSHTIQIEEKTVNGVTLTVRTSGLENDGDLILFMHGFPENAKMWDPAMLHMAEKGFRCIAPDQRGYSAKARFDDITNYRVPNMVADAFALVEAYGGGKFHIVGHDWGSVISWRM
ncbi:MAG TPA: alpha/beta fold hydrolase, partial [Clostridiaceae bacterium]|nr:alpha/beta fold hydrolase [Clostridiaceae bacterium]